MQSMIPAAERYNLRGGNERKKEKRGRKVFMLFFFVSLFLFLYSFILAMRVRNIYKSMIFRNRSEPQA